MRRPIAWTDAGRLVQRTARPFGCFSLSVTPTPTLPLRGGGSSFSEGGGSSFRREGALFRRELGVGSVASVIVSRAGSGEAEGVRMRGITPTPPLPTPLASAVAAELERFSG